MIGAILLWNIRPSGENDETERSARRCRGYMDGWPSAYQGEGHAQRS